MVEKVPRGRFGDGKLWGSAEMGMENVGMEKENSPRRGMGTKMGSILNGREWSGKVLPTPAPLC
jgi:hypothetical protein